MGIDLKLLVVDLPDGRWGGDSATVLRFGRYPRLFKRLNAAAKVRSDYVLWANFSQVTDGTNKGEDCYGRVTTTPYGDPITYITAGEFLTAVGNERYDKWATASIAYLKSLPEGVLIALYYY